MRRLVKNPALIFVVFLLAAVGVFALSPLSDCRAPGTGDIAVEEAAEPGWANCSVVQVPLEIGLEIQNVVENPGGADEKGGIVEVLLSVTPLREAKSFSWHLELPSGVTSYSGPADWSGLVAKDQTASFVFTLAVPDGKSYYFDAVGEYEAITGAKVRKSKALEIDLGAPQPDPNPSFVRVDDTGRKVVSYRGTTLGGGR
jgi:hypothetical protein